MFVSFRLNQAPEPSTGKAPVGMWLAGSNRARDEEGAALDFDGLVRASEGIDRLGVLRMDVDNLGEILRTGLPDNEASFSRITNLSRSLSYFFGGHLSAVLSEPHRHPQGPGARSGRRIRGRFRAPCAKRAAGPPLSRRTR